MSIMERECLPQKGNLGVLKSIEHPKHLQKKHPQTWRHLSICFQQTLCQSFLQNAKDNFSQSWTAIFQLQQQIRQAL